MNALIVDASVGIKWFIPEVLTAEALSLRSGTFDLHVPAFFDIEITNILWKKTLQGLVSRSQAELLVSQLSALPLTRHADSPQLSAAYDLAERTKRTVYDCLYLAHALQLGATMVTADERLVNSLAGTTVAASIARLQDVVGP